MTNTATSSNRNVVPSEVGWQFVPQYYTFVNKQPDALHRFYTKKSTFIHGTEGEDGKPCHGQQEIHQKILSIGFEDCKVFIHSVDAQSSADGGIIIQVIGEMSNHGDPWRKFVQTFFLAEQPNGYFVLNDIFRFLKEESVEEGEELEEEPEPAPAPIVSTPAIPEPEPEPAPAPAPVAAPAPVEPPREPTPPPPPAPEPVELAPPPAPVAEPPTTVDVPEPSPPPPPPAKIPSPAPVPAAAEPPRQNGIHLPAPVPAPAAAEPAPAPSPTPTPAIQAPAPEKKPATPPAPKTWANLAAANPKKWGSAVAHDSRGTTEVVPSSSSPAPTASGAQTPTSTGGGPTSGPAKQPHPAYVAAQNITTPHCFIKGVVENITGPSLSQQLAQRFGPVKDIDVVRSKACAFVEFASVDSAKRAIIASLNPGAGGEGGVYVQGESAQMRLSIETRKERGDRPPSRPRGGAPSNGDGGRGGASTGGGSFRGRGGRGGRGGK